MKGIVRFKDFHSGHTCNGFHVGSVLNSSQTVKVNGKGVARNNDLFTCGDKLKGNPSINIRVNSKTVCRELDMTRGHGCFPPAQIVDSSPNVKI